VTFPSLESLMPAILVMLGVGTQSTAARSARGWLRSSRSTRTTSLSPYLAPPEPLRQSDRVGAPPPFTGMLHGANAPSVNRITERWRWILEAHPTSVDIASCQQL